MALFYCRQGKRFSILHSVQTASGAHTASYPMGTGVPFPGIKRPGREADNRHPFSAAVRNGLHDMVLINYAQGQFYLFYLTVLKGRALYFLLHRLAFKIEQLCV
jgi:hypothetical protein